MTKVLRFTRAEIVNAALIAREHNVAVKLDRDGSMLVFPDIHKVAGVDGIGDDSGSSLQKWKRSRDAGKAHGRP